MEAVKCPICHIEFVRKDNEYWKKICYDCYKNYRHFKRIEKVGWKSDVYITHPNVTKKELQDWITDNKKEIGWGPVEYDRKKVKIWINSTNYD